MHSSEWFDESVNVDHGMNEPQVACSLLFFTIATSSTAYIRFSRSRRSYPRPQQADEWSVELSSAPLLTPKLLPILRETSAVIPQASRSGR